MTDSAAGEAKAGLSGVAAAVLEVFAAGVAKGYEFGVFVFAVLVVVVLMFFGGFAVYPAVV